MCCSSVKRTKRLSLHPSLMPVQRTGDLTRGLLRIHNSFCREFCRSVRSFSNYSIAFGHWSLALRAGSVVCATDLYFWWLLKLVNVSLPRNEKPGI